MKVFVVLVMCICVLTGCTFDDTHNAEPAHTPVTTAPFSPATAVVPAFIPIVVPTPYATRLIEPSPPVPPATPTPISFETVDEMRDYFGLPPELYPSVENDFPTDIVTYASVYVSEYEPYAGVPSISAIMAYKNDTLLDLLDLTYGSPPMPAMEYMDYIDDRYWADYGENPYLNYGNYHNNDDDMTKIDPNDWFFETEFLHRDMTFYVYNGSQFVGTGHIAKMPEFITYYREVFLRAEFMMDDPSIELEKGVSYRAISGGGWNPFPSVPKWDGYTFKVDIDGKGKTVSGEFIFGQHELFDFGDPDDDYWYFEVVYRGVKYPYTIGSWHDPNYPASMFYDLVDFADVDGDGNMELLLEEEWGGGWNRQTISFKEKEPATLLWQGGRF